MARGRQQWFVAGMLCIAAMGLAVGAMATGAFVWLASLLGLPMSMQVFGLSALAGVAIAVCFVGAVVEYLS